MSDLAGVIEKQLTELGCYIRNSDWYGRENELVNLFAHMFLGRAINPAQIGIEVAVKQLPRAGGKTLVRKDLVIWHLPNETVWRDRVPANDPAAVIEFKVNDSAKCAPDLEWLCAYTQAHPSVLGYSVCGYLKEVRALAYTRIENGSAAAQQVVPADAVLVASLLGRRG
jgi:hypothetical protein